MTTEQRKEELRKKFETFYNEFALIEGDVTYGDRDEFFNWFYSEIESRDKRAELYEYEVEALKRVVREYEAERRRLEEIIKAQNDVIEKAKKMDAFVVEALEHYNKLKSKT